MIFKKDRKRDDVRDKKKDRLEEENIPFEDLLKVKGVRTMETDAREYKEKQEKYGDDVPPYDPYLSSSELSDRDDLIAQKARETTSAPFEIRREMPETSTSDLGAGLEEQLPNETEESVTESVLDKGVEREYDFPNIQTKSKTEAETEDVEEEPIEEPNRKPSQYKDEETILRESIEYLARQHAELLQKLEHYRKNKKKVFEEKQDFVLKKEEIEKTLKPILGKEKEKESEIEEIERAEEIIKNEEELRAKEKERWTKEDERQAIEKKKWGLSDDLETINKFIKDRDELSASLAEKEKETQDKIKETETEKKKKEIQLRILQIRRSRKQAEDELNNFKSQLIQISETISGLVSEEGQILEKKKKVEEKEKKAGSSEEEKEVEALRWDLEKRLRQVEGKRWQVSDQKVRLQQLAIESEKRLQLILSEENEVEAELKTLS